jgi:shikimate dehydrogenase
MDHYAVVGFPVKHSKSPFIHAMFAEQTGQSLQYDRIEIEPSGFDRVVKDFFEAGGCGLNITVPHKESAWRLVDWHALNAEKAGAVNTIYKLPDGRLAGDNTDGIGLVRDIEHNHATRLAESVVLILGAGGAVRGLLPRLIKADPARIVIANRTLARAEDLRALFAGEFEIEIRSNHQLDDLQPDWIINGSSAGLSGEMPSLPPALICSATNCYDMVYAPGGTVFQQWAKSLGAVRALDGTGMLVEQAAESFYLWRGIRPDTAPVLSALRRMLEL